MVNFIKRLFYTPNWKIAYKTMKDDHYNVFEPDSKYWCADPFIIEAYNKIYIFMECFIKEKNKGSIAIAEYKDNKLINFEIIIENNYHMSYPCVFEYNGSHYMIPETKDNKTLELYKAVDFPYCWVLDTVLLSNIELVDSTVFNANNEFFVISYEMNRKNKHLLIYKLDMNNKTIKLCSKTDADNTKRPAGNIYKFNNKLIRPSQDCRYKYGEKIILNEIISFKEDIYHEEVVGFISGENIKLNSDYKADRVHIANRIKDVEVIDFSKDKFDLFRVIKKCFKG